MRNVAAAFLSVLLLSACQGTAQQALETPITKSVVSDASAAVPSGPLHDTVITGLQNASWNLDGAVKVGALADNDPAPGCLHSILSDLGIDPNAPVTAADSFTPRVTDLVSAGSVLYIRARQAEALAGSGGPKISIPCKAMLGQIVMDAAKVANQVGVSTLPGAGLIQKLLP